MEYKREKDRVQGSRVILTERWERDHSDDGLNCMADQTQGQ